MSPEQAISLRDVTAATDIYALGATLTFAAARHYPYQGETGRDTQNAITDPAVEPDLSGIPAVLLPAISGMLAYAAAARLTVGEVHAELAKIPRGRGRDRPGRRRLAFGGGHLPEQPWCPRAPANHPAAAAVAGSGRRPARPERAHHAGSRLAPPRLRRIGVLLATTLTAGNNGFQRTKRLMTTTDTDANQAATPFPPGARIEVRGAEWLVRNCTQTAHSGYKITATGVSEFVREGSAVFFTALEDPSRYSSTPERPGSSATRRQSSRCPGCT